MPEYFPNNPYSQPVQTGPRMSLWDRVKQNVKNRFTEPYEGLFHNIIGDNYRSFKRRLLEVFAPEEERDEKGVPNAVLPAMHWHAVSAFQRTMGAVFGPFAQLFGGGVGEFLNWKWNDVVARTEVGGWASVVFAKDAVKETLKFIRKPFAAAWIFSTGITEDFIDNTIVGGARITVGATTGMRADSLRYQQPYEPMRPQTHLSRLSHTNPWIDNVEAHRDMDYRNVAFRDGYRDAVDAAVYQPPSGNNWAVPYRDLVVNSSAPNLTAANDNKAFQEKKSDAA